MNKKLYCPNCEPKQLLMLMPSEGNPRGVVKYYIKCGYIKEYAYRC